MGYRVCGTNIRMTRGDTVKVLIGLSYDQNGEEYIPEEGDLVRFSVKKYLSDKTPLISKDIPIDTLLLVLKPEDTKALPFGPYHYDVQLIQANGEVCTVIEDSILELTGEVD